jgi:FkbM family methyltransferase
MSLTSFLPPQLKKYIRKPVAKIRLLEINIRRLVMKIYYYCLRSSSQYGEDLVLDKLLMNKKDGFFVDIGANHPTHLSNTYRFHKKGWVGINVEPDPRLYINFIDARRNDVNLNVGVGPVNGKMPFYRISANTLSTFNKESADGAIKDGHQLLDVKDLPVMRLDAIFEKYHPNGLVDFMSIDVEGFEMSVLSSNNWDKFRPNYLIIEINQNGNKIKQFLKNEGYSGIFDNGTNCIFRDEK